MHNKYLVMTFDLANINIEGVLIGAATFLIIGICHPLVIKGEYYFGKKCRWWFLIAGIVFLIAALCAKTTIASSLLGVSAFSCFWSIKEILDQVKRVEKGWFPANPKREYNFLPGINRDTWKLNRRTHQSGDRAEMATTVSRSHSAQYPQKSQPRKHSAPHTHKAPHLEDRQ